MKLKVLTCDCFIDYMRETDVHFEVQNTFGSCECSFLLHRIIVPRCGFYHFNVNGFCCSYFASVSCGCQFQGKDKRCKHCDRLEIALNVNVQKVCLNEEDFPKRYKFYDFSLFAKTLPGDPFFAYDKHLNCIVKRIDSIDWGDFFCRERNDVNSLQRRNGHEKF